MERSINFPLLLTARLKRLYILPDLRCVVVGRNHIDVIQRRATCMEPLARNRGVYVIDTCNQQHNSKGQRPETLTELDQCLLIRKLCSCSMHPKGSIP